MLYGVCAITMFSKTLKKKKAKQNMAAWRSHLNNISTASELDEEISSNQETSADNGIPLAGYADKSEREEASGDESEISRKSSAGNCNSGKKGIGSSATVSRCKSCSIRLRIKLKVALDTRKVFLNLVSLYVFHI